MARVKDGINGVVNGIAGNSVFYTMHGKNYVRSRPAVNKRHKPSLKQQHQQQRMALVQLFLQPFIELLKLSFASVTEANPTYHVPKSYNLLHAIKGDTYPDQEIDLSKTYLSAGSLDLLATCSVKRNDGALLFS
jgi:hypothetical protein